MYLCGYILTHGVFNLEVLFKNYFVLAGEPVMDMWNQKRYTHIHVIILLYTPHKTQSHKD